MTDMGGLRSGDLADASLLRAAIERTLPGVITTAADGDAFVFYDPDGITDPTARFPFATIITRDHDYDDASRLDRDERTFRLNCGVSRERYESFFGPAPRQAAGYTTIDTGFDYSLIDQVLPHPLYSPLHWVCVVNPGEETRETLNELLADAHLIAQKQHERRKGRSASDS